MFDLINFGARQERDRDRELADVQKFLAPDIERRRAEHETGRIAMIKLLLAKNADIVAERARIMPPLVDEVSAAHAEEDRLEKALSEAKKRRINADLSRFGASCEFQRRIAEFDASIRALAPAVIEEFIGEMLHEMDELRTKYRSSQRTTEKHWITGKSKIFFSDNTDSLNARMAHIRAAIVEALEMKVSALPESEIVERLNKLRQTMPEIVEQEREFTPIDVAELQRGN